jgi:tRNA pseudouridine synthase 10
MTIYDRVLKIYQKYENTNLSLCLNCLGRMFSLLGTNTSNLERGNSLLLSITMENHRKYLSMDNKFENESINNLKILAENANFLPAQKVLENEGFELSKINFNKTCYLCENIFLNLQKYVDKAKQMVTDIEFKDFLVGTSPDSEIINKEDKFKSELNLLNSESFKSHFNREIGKKLSIELNKPVEFNNPEIVFIYLISYNEFNINLIIKSIFISGRYKKLLRGIPQTHWTCTRCSGKGCEGCNFTGKLYETSVEEFISPEFVVRAQALESKFHGAGREDIDVRMLGSGRPFILELKNPKKRTLDLNQIKKRVNKINKGKVNISDLKYSNKKEVISIKTEAENTKKIYKALIETEKRLNKKEFKELLEKLKIRLENKKISQRTPNRVSHRRADVMREKTIYKIDGHYLKPKLSEFVIETQGGTYIKELIHGDNGRTTPSFSSIFGFQTMCKELDVLSVKK